VAERKNRKATTSTKIRPKVVTLPKNAKCAICGLSKPLDFSHVVPQRIVLLFEGVDKRFIDYDGDNIILLCKNHHALYERHELEQDDFRKIWLDVHSAMLSFSIHISELAGDGKKINDAIDELKKFTSNLDVYNDK
jgi:predicted restriction endonuclease